MLTDTQLANVSSLRAKALAVGVVGTLLGLAAAATGIERVFQVFLIAYLLWLGLAVGCMALVMLHHLCGGGWSYLGLRPAEAASRTLPFFLVLGFLVLVGGVYVGNLYPWTNAEYLQEHHIEDIVARKATFLNPAGFTFAFFVYFGLWGLFTVLYNRWSKQLQETGDMGIVNKLKGFAGPFLVLYVISLTFAATHWSMSLEPEWFSTIYGAWLIASYALSTVAFIAIVLSYLAKEGPIARLITPKHFLHYGNFMLGFTIFWSYIAFSQFLIIWNGNIPEEIGWYLHRQGNQLNILIVILMIGVWFAPMMWLMTRSNKTDPARLRKMAYYILATRVLDMYWNVAPSYPDHHSTINWVTAAFTLAAVAGIGGLWLWAFLGQLTKRSIILENDPRLEYYFADQAAHGHGAEPAGSEAHG